MGFKESEVDRLLAGCHRRCCICHKFCGFKMETHHIKQKADGGKNDIQNAIPLCFECHAEVALYNPKHPKGRKYTNGELLEHRKQWLDLCKKHPEILVNNPTNKDIGPLEGMLIELELNLRVAKLAEGPFPWDRIGNSLRMLQYDRAISEGTFLLLSSELKDVINEAYISIGRINNFVTMLLNTRPEGTAYGEAKNNVITSLRSSTELIEKAFNSLKIFLNTMDAKFNN